MSESARTLLIDQGDLPSLAAIMIEPDPARLIIWHRETQQPNAAHCAMMAREHAALVEAQFAVEASRAFRTTAVLAEAEMLIAACTAARKHGCRRIVWPVQVGPEARLVGLNVECAAIIADVASLDGSEPIEIDLPLVELAEDQIVDLVDDAGGPLDLFRACPEAGEHPCGGCPECTRWAKALEERGLAASTG